MTYKIIKNINDRTHIAIADDKQYILKEIPFSDSSMYKKLKNIKSDNIVKFYETTAIDDKFYVVEEFIDGTTLRDLVSINGCFSEGQTMFVITRVCEGLKAIHKLGIVHRDINPNNIMISKDGVVKIIDFGISRTVKANKSQDTEILGTQGFAAPEQFGFHQTNEKADIYSVGVLINYLMTKQLPIESLVKGYFSEIVLKCTQIDETRRYSSMDELISAIGKGNKIKKFIKSIPGFRKGIWWHVALACFYYVALAFCYLCSFLAGKNIPECILIFSVFFFGFGLPVPLLMNYKNWVNCFSFTVNKTKKKKVLIQVAFCIVSEMISFSLIILDIYITNGVL